jgi:glutamyl-Q tRNA(Asp) synthetase
MPPEFVTRFAPSPTGPLHLGHAYSAMLAHDMARAAGGRFLLRIEDIDRARCKQKFETAIYEDLRWLGLTWDAPVLRQSDHVARYGAALDLLGARGFTYPCGCSRADIRASLSAPQDGVTEMPYPGTCRHKVMDQRRSTDAVRLKLHGETVSFTETGAGHAGMQNMRLAAGDPVLGRKDIGTVAYALACVVDDAAQAVTHVVRGADLFDFTGVQVHLQQLLGFPTPIYHHHRLIRDEAGKRLAKRDDARALSKYRAEGATPADIRALVGLTQNTSEGF